jgi:hypothetical protein
MPIGFFLGAGCPAAVKSGDDGKGEPLIPDVGGLTRRVSRAISDNDEFKEPFRLVCEQLETDGTAEPNIEHILTHVRSLRQAAGNAEVRGLKASQLKDLDAHICQMIDNCTRVELPDSETAYHLLASWIGGISRKHSVEIFTPNYDLLIEQALEESGVPYFDGFVGSYRTFFDPASMELGGLPARWARLWKLHGSINWRQDPNSKVVSRGEGIPDGEAHLIHPSHLKYDESRQMPYLAMFDRLHEFLKRTPSVLVTCGFSFSDQHLNNSILQGLQGNPSAVCFALLHGKLDRYETAVRKALQRTNLNLLALDGAVIAGRRGEWQIPPDVDPTAHPIALESHEESGSLALFLAVQIDASHRASDRCPLIQHCSERSRMVRGATISVSLDRGTVSGLTFVEGRGYRIGQVGSFVRIPLGFIDLFGVVSQVGAGAVPDKLQDDRPFGNRWMTVQLVGEGQRGGVFQRGISQYPTIDDTVHLVTDKDLERIYGSRQEEEFLEVGRVASAESIPALVDINRLVTRHTAVVGATGAGKSHSCPN